MVRNLSGDVSLAVQNVKEKYLERQVIEFFRTPGLIFCASLFLTLSRISLAWESDTSG